MTRSSSSIRMVWALGFALPALAAAGCAGLGSRRPTDPPQVGNGPAGVHPLPAISQETDPDNVERRFGFEEAQARRDEARRQAAGAPNNKGVIVQQGTTPATPAPASAPSTVTPAALTTPPTANTIPRGTKLHKPSKRDGKPASKPDGQAEPQPKP